MRTLDARDAVLAVGAFVAGATLAGALAVLGGPFRVLTQETCAAFAAIGLVGWTFVAAEVARRTAGHEGGVLLGGLLLGAGGLAVHLALDEAVLACRTESGAVRFVVTWVPVALFGSAFGTLAGRWRRRALALALATLVAACVAHDLVQGMVGVRVVDPLLGDPSFLDQRARIGPDALVVMERAWLGGVAVVLALVHAAASETRVRPLAAAAGLAVAVGTLLGASRLGLGLGMGRIDAYLDGRRVSTHFVVHYRRGGAADLRLPLMVADAEFAWSEVAGAFVAPDDHRPVHLYLYDDDDALGDLTGQSAAHAWNGVVHAATTVPSSTLAHELVHALHARRVASPLLLLNRGMVEGTAVAWSEGTARDPLLHTQAAALLANGDLPSAEAFTSIFGFWTVNERTAYVAAGSFVGWLALTYGPDQLWQVQRMPGWERAYGADIAALDARWRAFLATVPVDLRARQVMRTSYDRRMTTPYFGRRCPKVGSVDREPHELARDLLAASDPAGAAPLYDAVLREKPAPGWAGLAADAWSAAGEPERALDRVRQGLALPGVMRDEQATLLETEIRIRLDAGDLAGADAALVALAEVEPAHPGDDQVRALLADPEAGRAAALALSRRDWVEQRDSAIALYSLRPDDPVARRLYAQHVLMLPSGTWELRLSRARAADLEQALVIAADPTTCDELDDALVTAGFTAARLGAVDLARRTADRVARSCTRPQTVAQVKRIEARAAFEVR